MAETSAMNSDNKVEQAVALTAVGDNIKKEVDVKSEPQECLLCVTRTRECHDIYGTSTTASGTSLHQFLLKFTQVNLTDAHNCSKYICKSCYDLINVLEQAEIEYTKLKETFEAIISKNPLFENGMSQMKLSVKSEIADDDDDDESVNFANLEEDSEDEPLVRKKRRRKVHTKKKKPSTTGKRKVAKIEQSWECDICGLQGDTGGAEAEMEHKISKHALNDNPVLRDVKTEDSADGSQSPYNNGFESCLQIGFENFDGESSLLEPVDKSTKKRKVTEQRKSKLLSAEKLKKPKVMHQCDQCSARYSSPIRLEQHKQKHDGSKPPYICEICGAHYKHKRACDIHIAMHKGISDWKCEECNKLFPSKNALQRHNNIHTGKLNYQCDLCGKSFIHTSSFKMHKLSHSGVKPHACDVCGLALMTRSHLKRHKRIHSGEKRHECGVCGKRFSERYNLAAHSKAHAPDNTGRDRDAPRRRLFRCGFCPERFERRYMLERHTASAHGRTLERPPPTPRNTMSKLLKAQALARAPHTATQLDLEPKPDRSPESPATPVTPQKLIAHLSSSTSIITSSSWSGAYAAEFGLRPEFPH
ncbi:zinc finger protein 62 homolog [Manduca sexta]|uniref:C2H2-type domain-containing protein n=1 Tax=Manduca sexta TaxID=7130 RepID=A0A921YRF8_MANSE|nr:zinc finger protein 62 homolog [Manduca sexta]KAG6443968.1 hypothetical protein O3G_MSEX003076 [Manduca sexta]KAG6443969.1 hypothetical protein O3G_MSEX003076 [Manduca sexta]